MLTEAFTSQLNTSVDEGADSNSVIENLCEKLTNAIVYFVESAEINTNDILDPGCAATSAYGIGIYSSIESGSGKGKIISNNRNQLMTDLVTAYKKSKNNSLVDNPTSIIENLSFDISNAIKKFLLQCSVTTEVKTFGGTPVVGYIMPAGTPITSISLPITALGTGKLL